MADEPISPEAKVKQVAQQVRVVRMLCATIAEAHKGYAEMLGVGCRPASLESIGRRSATVMEMLRDIMKAMDAADDEDEEWMIPVFEEARRMFPPAAEA
jgi:hypothetical protein